MKHLPSRDEILEECRKAHPALLVCWLCHEAKGKYPYLYKSFFGEEWSIRIACARCIKKIK